jgi:hypothetical protein
LPQQNLRSTSVVMKVYLLAVVAALAACGKKNDVHVLHHEAVTLAKYYAPKLDALDGRVQAIFKRGSNIPGNLPGIEAVGRRLQEARDTIVQLRGILGPGPDQKSAVEKQADAAAKDGKVTELQKLVHDTELTIDRGLTVINDDLNAVEEWIANYDRRTLALAQAPATPAEAPPPPTPAPAPEAAPAPGSAVAPKQ